MIILHRVGIITIVKDQAQTEAELVAAERTRGSLAGIMVGGWIRAINQAQGIFNDPENGSETRARAALIMLVAAEDWAFRSKDERRTKIQTEITQKLYAWLDDHQPELSDELASEVKMEEIKHDLRYAGAEEQQSLIHSIEAMDATSQKAVLMARVARITKDEELMADAVELQEQYDNPERLAVLKRWQAELSDGSKLVEYKEKILRVVYGEIIGRIPWSLLVPEKLVVN